MTSSAIPTKKIFLNFSDPELEKDFRQDIAHSQKRYVRLAAIIMMSIYIVFGFIDDLPSDDQQSGSFLLILRYLVVVPTCAAFVGFTYTAFYERSAQVSAFITVLIVGSI